NPRGGERRIACKQIVLAIGGTDFPRKLGIPGDDLPHVDGYLREPHNYYGRKLLIVGGKNSAVEAALRCHHAGANVSLSYRRDALPERSIKYWLYPEITGLMKAGRIGEHLGTVPTKITPTHVTLQPVMQNGGGSSVSFEPAGESYDVEADEVLSLIGYRQRSDLFEAAGIEMNGDERMPTFDEDTMQTNVPGIYVAGTAIGGTQMRFKVFLENCHVHAKRIARHITGENVAEDAELPANVVAQPES
ncbi:MAG: NAD(P)-binding domain-containing protein, partial [Planctomycetota bacterium]